MKTKILKNISDLAVLFLLILLSCTFSRVSNGSDKGKSTANSELINLDSTSKISAIVPVTKINNIDSSHLIRLKEIGNVYVHQVEFERYEGYQQTEAYSRLPGIKYIKGIERFGPFRLYTDVPVKSDSTYSNEAKIEFLSKDNIVTKTVFPIKNFNLFKGNSYEQNTINGNDLNSYIVKVEDYQALIDPMLTNLNKEVTSKGPLYFTSDISYEIENKSLIVNLSYHTTLSNDLETYSYESIVYDSTGILLGHVQGYGAVTNTDLTLDNNYFYVNTGGAISEHQALPYTFTIFDLKENKFIFSKNANSGDCLGGGTIHNTNYGAYAIRTDCGSAYNVKEMYVIDHKQNKIYFLHTNKQCGPQKEISVYDGYCECYGKDNIKTKLYYNMDFNFDKFIK